MHAPVDERGRTGRDEIEAVHARQFHVRLAVAGTSVLLARMRMNAGRRTGSIVSRTYT